MKGVTTRFIANEGLWQEIQTRIKGAKKVRAAIAYLGQNGAELLPLKKGHQLVVDMSIGTVRQGATDPREIRKLTKRGVEVFSRSSLHAKFMIIDKTLIASSANISKNSMQTLDEAGVITTDSATILRASDYFEKLCTEPVLDDYLKKCIESYRPPKFKAGKRQGAKSQRRVQQAKLWFIGGVQLITIPDEEVKSITKVEQKAEKKLTQPGKSSVDWIRFARRSAFLKHIRIGDWIVECIYDGKSRRVSAPAQVIDFDTYVAPNGHKKYMLMLAWRNDSQYMSFAKFRQKARSLVPMLDEYDPHTQPIKNMVHADRILSLWTASGRVSRKRK